MNPTACCERRRRSPEQSHGGTWTPSSEHSRRASSIALQEERPETRTHSSEESWKYPAKYSFVRLPSLNVDLSEAGALVTGIQHAQVRIDGEDIDDCRAFVDWFVTHGGSWRIRVAVDVPLAEGSSVEAAG